MKITNLQKIAQCGSVAQWQKQFGGEATPKTEAPRFCTACGRHRVFVGTGGLDECYHCGAFGSAPHKNFYRG